MILWAESFEYYDPTIADGRTTMLQGLWAEFTSGTAGDVELSSAEARTGTYSLHWPFNSLGTGIAEARRVIPETTSFGFCYGVRCVALPTSGNVNGMELRSQAGTAILSLAYLSDGSIQVMTGDIAGVAVGISSQALTAGAWHHIEVKINVDDIVGSIEVRVDGSTVLTLINQDFGTTGIVSLVWGRYGSSSVDGIEFYVDDIVTWDTTGTINNDFLGTVRVLTQFVDADTAQADWGVTGAPSPYQAIDDISPDDDTSYISGVSVNDQSDFGIQDLPPEIASIAAIFIPSRMRIEDAGTAQVRIDMLSGVSAAQGVDRAVTTNYQYWPDLFETNPVTGVKWTRTEFNAALVSIVKTV